MPRCDFPQIATERSFEVTKMGVDSGLDLEMNVKEKLRVFSKTWSQFLIFSCKLEVFISKQPVTKGLGRFVLKLSNALKRPKDPFFGYIYIYLKSFCYKWVIF